MALPSRILKKSTIEEMERLQLAKETKKAETDKQNVYPSTFGRGEFPCSWTKCTFKNQALKIQDGQFAFNAESKALIHPFHLNKDNMGAFDGKIFVRVSPKNIKKWLVESGLMEKKDFVLKVEDMRPQAVPVFSDADKLELLKEVKKFVAKANLNNPNLPLATKIHNLKSQGSLGNDDFLYKFAMLCMTKEGVLNG